MNSTPGLGPAAHAGWLPSPTRLPRLADALAALGRPLVLMVSLVDCPFCHRVRSTEMRPRQQEGLVVAEMDISGPRTLVDFAGASATHRDIARRYRVQVAPTVLWLDRSGKEVAERLVGASIPDFYGAYFDERMAAATAALKR
jgi:hypothetical protein